MPLLRVTYVYFVFSHLQADTLHAYPTTHPPYHYTGIKNNTRAVVVVLRESHISCSGALQYPAGIRNNTHNAIIKQQERDTSVKGTPQHPKGIKNNTRAVVV